MLTRLDLAVKGSLQPPYEVHLESVCISENICVDWWNKLAVLKKRILRSSNPTEHLVWFAESEIQPILLHKLPILL